MRSLVLGVAALLASLSINSASAQTLGCTSGGTGGAIPTAGTGGGGAYPATLPVNPLVSNLTVSSVPPGSTSVTEVKLNGLNHAYGGDVQFVLTDPAGVKTNLWVRQGGGCDFTGDYVIAPRQVPSINFPACAGALTPPGTYEQNFFTWPDGTNNIFNRNLSSIAPQTGTWTLTIYDWASGFSGSLTSWELCFGVPPPAPPPPPTPCNGPQLAALPYAGGNGGSNNGQIFIDVTVTNPAGITLSQIDLHSDDNIGQLFSVDIYTCPSTWVGNEATPSAWTLQASGDGVLAGLGQPSLAEFPDFPLAPGSYGLTIVFTSGNAGHTYTNGTGANQNFSNADLAIAAGGAQNVPWNGTVFTPRVFNGALRYNCPNLPPVVSYCTAGTSTNGCVPAISASTQPSVSQASSCLLSVAGVEGQKSGLIFYGVDNTGYTPLPWAATSSSFLCAKPPTQRLGFQSSGGTAGFCDGTLAQNLSTFLNANPAALGQPFAVGQKAYAQAWYRDPPAAKTTNLSDAVELTFVP